MGKTRHGLPNDKAAPTTTTQSLPTYKPVSDEVTVYGAKKFRTPTFGKEFSGTKGKPIPAGILDIDGTLQDWGSTINKEVLDWMDKLMKKYPKMVWLVVTARDHEFMYDTSFNWLCAHLPYPFIGPFCRAKSDPRFASEFKRELAQGFEDMGLYKIVAAADDNKYVNDMWKYWAIDHFDDSTEFSLLECNYRDYTAWREDVRKPFKSPVYTSYTSPPAKNRPAGTPYISSWGTDPADGKYKKREEFLANVQVGDPIDVDPVWETYFKQREAKGAYVGAPAEPEDRDVELEGYSLTNEDIELMALHANPNLTPEDITQMSTAELREVAGISEETYREQLYNTIETRFGGRYFDNELDELDIDDIENLASMTQDEADHFMNIAYYSSRYGADLMDLTPPDRQARIEARMELEDEVYAISDLTKKEIAEMDVEDLRQKLDEALGHTQMPPPLPPSGAGKEIA